MRTGTLPEPAYRVTLGLITAAFALTTLLWATLTPGFRAPDEPKHVNSVIRLMYGGGWPAPGEAWRAPILDDAVEQSGRRSDLPGARESTFDTAFVDVSPSPDDTRIRVTGANALPGDDPQFVDQMTQHPPLYYVIEAGVVMALGLDGARWDVQLYVMRLVSVLMAAPLPLLVAGITRRLTGSRALALAGATLPLLVPQLTYISGVVSNDNLLTLAGALMAYLLVRVVDGDLRYRIVLALGVVLGVGMLTKAFMVLLLPSVGIAFVVARRNPILLRLRQLVVVTAIALAVGGWWWIRNFLVLGVVLPGSVLRTPSQDQEHATFAEYAARAVGLLAQSFWGQIASHSVLKLPGALVVVASAATVAMVVLGLGVRAARPGGWLLAGNAGLVGAAVIVQGYSNHLTYGGFPGLQGRYLFVTVAGLLAVVAAGLGLIARSERSRLMTVPIVTCGGLAGAAVGVWFAFAGFYLGPAGVVDAGYRWVAWSPLVGWQVVGLLTALAVVGIFLAAQALSLTRNARPALPRHRRP